MVWKVLSLAYVKLRTRGPIGWGPYRDWCHFHATGMIKLFLITAHGSMGIGGNVLEKCKVLRLAHKRNETWDKQLLSRDPDRRWCHRHTSVKLSWLQSMDWAAAHWNAAANVHEAIGCYQKRFALVWRWHQLLSGFLPNSHLSRVLHWL